MKLQRTLLAPLILVALISSTMANAFDLSAKPIGSITRWRTDNGNTSVEMLARDGKLFKLAFTRDNSKGQPDFAILWTRKDGQEVEITSSSGEWTRFKPHNCTLTIGKCRYTEKRSNGQKRKMIRISSMRNGKTTYALYHTRIKPTNLVEKGRFTVDRYGYMIDRDYTQNGSHQRWSRRIRAAEPSS